jgi:hypothetical protein
LELGVQAEPECDCISGALVISRVDVVVFGVQIVVQKNCVIVTTAQQLSSLVDVVRNIKDVSPESDGEPFVTPFVVVQEKDPNRMALRLYRGEA